MSVQQKDSILVVISDPQINYLLERVLKSAGFYVTICPDAAAAQRELEAGGPALLILGEKLSDAAGLDLAATILHKYPAVPIVFFVSNDKPELLKSALRIGVSDYLCLPLKADDILKSVQNGLAKARVHKEWVLLEARRATAGLHQRLDEIDALTRLGQSVTSSLDLDCVLTAIVDAAVELTGAEEGSLLLVDPASGELYMRAARNFQEDFVRKFRLPIQDTLAGTVLRTGQPVILDEQTPQKIKTAYLVHSLAYVPLQSQGRVFGVLGVDNRLDRTALRERDLKMLLALAEYAVIAIDNAGLYENISRERNKLDTILTNIQDGVIVIDRERQIIFINKIAQGAFGLLEQQPAGRSFDDVFAGTELFEMVSTEGESPLNRTEITVGDGRIFGILLTTIPDVGLAITMNDITNLKRLDQIKSEFVSTVSHDLRSPLTAILGYVELLERVGPMNDIQHDFVKRVQVSVHNITNLVGDLLNLGRIEAGFDTRMETVQVDRLIRLSAESFQRLMAERRQQLVIEMPEQMPAVLANPVQMRQVVDNLLDNACKYTPQGGKVTVRAGIKQSQLVFQVIDTGIGIPSIDLPFIFDKFYRASNSSMDVTGSGLGLAIVKSIIEAHHGRIWVDSTLGQGTTFSIVLPVQEKESAEQP